MHHSVSDATRWMATDSPFNAFGAMLRHRFGGRVQRVSIDAGFTCPNVDGTVATGGCNFCDNRSFSPSRRVRLQQVRSQLLDGIKTVRERYKKVSGFIAYFQPATNTFAPVEQLREVFEIALGLSETIDESIVGLAIGTRPDCVPESVLELVEELSERSYVSLEYGMQTMHDEGLRWMNRAHCHDDLINAIDRSRGRGFETCVHVILGIPGEDHTMMMQTADEVARLGFDAVKLHNLYAVRRTPLGDQVERGEVTMMDREDYVQTVVDFLERLPPEMIVERVSGDAPRDFLLAPKWCLEKSAIREEIAAEFLRRGTRQGSRYEPPETLPSQRPVPPDLTPQAILDQINRSRRLPVLKMEDRNND